MLLQIRELVLTLHQKQTTYSSLHPLYFTGWNPAVLPGPPDSGHVHESAVPNESARTVWAVPARTLTGTVYLDNYMTDCSGSSLKDSQLLFPQY